MKETLALVINSNEFYEFLLALIMFTAATIAQRSCKLDVEDVDVLLMIYFFYTRLIIFFMMIVDMLKIYIAFF